MSIVDLIKSQLTSEVLDKLSGVIGESSEKTRTATNAAIPSVLAMIANSALSGKGLDGLLGALRDFEGTDPVATLKTPGATPTPPSGGDILGSLLGPNLSTLLNILSKFVGIGLPAIKTLLSYVGPLILSVLAAQLKGKGGLTPANLTSLLTAEKPNITKAIPAGLSLADLTSPPSSTPTTKHVTTTKVEEPALPGWLLPLLALGLIAAGLYFFMKPAEEPVAPAPAPAPAAATTPSAEAPKPLTPVEIAPAEPKLAIPTVDAVSKGLTEVYTGVTNALALVKDVPTAEAEAPKLTALSTELDTVKALWDKIPAEAKATVAKVTVDHLDTLKGVVAKVLEIPGVGEKLKPILDAIIAKLVGFSV
ncbi:DUF937 domain-containing protein [Paludisphaera rhizosphaerae]|uniref:DUF937 domain-containing protein n=1 Tax=Paludisphaera rhizosphaerae TaxID=2711216 RepID=UPI0013EB80EF|nr:DUF937 domain-containing protein [Paludisphaera rhizosphaerae]